MTSPDDAQAMMRKALQMASDLLNRSVQDIAAGEVNGRTLERIMIVADDLAEHAQPYTGPEIYRARTAAREARRAKALERFEAMLKGAQS